ncbi:MAG: stage III sporulation protein AB [Eubacteriales bacterium]|nr:stage III sporulation protein AB [Eubacteriales bacterium]
MFKLLGSIVIIGTCSCYGYYKASCVKKRIEYLSEFIQILEVMKSNIGYSYMELPEIFNKLSDNVNSKIFKDMFKGLYEELNKTDMINFGQAWNNGVKSLEKNNIFKPEEISAIKELDKITSYIDKDMQLTYIEMIKQELMLTVNNARDESSKKIRMYQILGVMTGMFIVVALI